VRLRPHDFSSIGVSASEAPALAPDPFNPRFWGAAVGTSASGQAVTAESALQLDVVQSVLERLGGTISTLPLQVFRRTGDETREVARDHPLYKVLHSHPGPGWTPQLFRDEQARGLAFYRNDLSIIRPAADGGPVGSLERVHWSRVQRVRRGADGRIYYDVRRLGMAAGVDTYRDDEVWHVKKAPLTSDGLIGQPVYQTAREVLATAQAVREFGNLYFANGGSGGGFFKHPSNFKTVDERDRFLETLRAGGTGLNRHRDRLLLNGVEYQQNKVANDESQFIETRKLAAADVARIWVMPPHMVGIMDNATFTNIEQQSIEFVVYTLGPWISAIEQSAALDLLVGADQDEYFVEMNVAGLLRGDIQARYKGYAQARQWGWFSVNDIRRMENMPPIGDAGDIYLSPTNMTPAGKPLDDTDLTETPEPDEDEAPGNQETG
jgi:HK97 family phage portal protein